MEWNILFRPNICYGTLNNNGAKFKWEDTLKNFVTVLNCNFRDSKSRVKHIWPLSGITSIQNILTIQKLSTYSDGFLQDDRTVKCHWLSHYSVSKSKLHSCMECACMATHCYSLCVELYDRKLVPFTSEKQYSQATICNRVYQRFYTNSLISIRIGCGWKEPPAAR